MKLLFFTFSLLPIFLFGQKLKILDRNTGRPIADVYVFHKENGIANLSDASGNVSLSEFPPTGEIIFQHPSYHILSTSLEKIKSEGYRVRLKEKIIPFDEITVAANRWEQDLKEVPNDITSIKASKISFDNPQTSADLLANSGHVFVQKSQFGGGSPTLRGFAANAVLLVVDGVRLNNAIYRGGNLQNVINIDPNAIQQTDVVFGPGSVIYGSDALGGVMHFKTKSPNWSNSNTIFKANAQTRYSSAANERTGHFDLTIADKKWTYFGSVSRSVFGDLRAGTNRTDAYEGFFERNFIVERQNDTDQLVGNPNPEDQISSGYNLTNIIQKLKFRTSETSVLSYSFFYSNTSNIPRYDRLTLPIDGTDSLVFAEWFYGPQTWRMHSLQFSSFKQNLLFDQSKITVSRQDYDESRNDRRFEDDRLRTRNEEVDVYTLNIDFEKSFGKTSIFYGLDGFYNDVTSTAQRRNLITNEITPTSTRYPDGGSQFYSFAAYGNLTHRLSEKLTLTAGIRYSQVRLKAETNDPEAIALFFDEIDLTNRAVTGSCGLTFNPNPNTKLSVLGSSGFRAPNVDDVGKIFEIDDNTIVVPNANLEPEFSYNQEIGWEQKFSNRIKFNIVAYHSFLENAIVRENFVTSNGAESVALDGDSPRSIRAQVNANRGRAYGGSVSLQAEINTRLGISSSLNVNEGRDVTNDQTLRHTTPVFGRTSVKYKFAKFRSEFFIDFNAKKGRNNIPDSEIIDKDYLYTDIGSPGWATLNFRFGYTPNKFLTIESGAENILDQHYRTYSSGISAPGRNLYISLKGSL